MHSDTMGIPVRSSFLIELFDPPIVVVTDELMGSYRVVISRRWWLCCGWREVM
jgi:hypothetical protein